MALVVADRVKETTTTVGTGTLTLAGAVTGFQSFAVIGNTNTTYYAISANGVGFYEVGIGTYTASGTTLSRDTVLASSNSGNKVDLPAGTKEVYVVYPAGRSVIVDGTSIAVPNSAVLPITAGGTGSNTATFSGANITSLNASNISSGTLGVARGGTGATSLTSENVIIGNNTSAVKFVAPGTSGNVLTSNGTAWASTAPASPSGVLTWAAVQTGNFNASAGTAYPVNTTSGAITATLPASPSAGQIITFVDYAGTWDTNRLTIAVNTKRLNGSTLDQVVSGTERGAVNLVYIDATQGWITYAGYSGTPSYATKVDVEYLVVAGGGGGGAGLSASNVGSGGGGGAGGFRTGTFTGLTPGTNYTVTVGGGGSGGVCGGGDSTNGNDSVFSTITSTGGGRGGGYAGTASGGNGGSGGGGEGGAAGNGNTPSTSPSQGNNGGTGTGATYNAGQGGGGGASATGGNGTTSAAGNGGNGTASSISGSSVTYAGGGGGGKSTSGTAGTGGTGGGGNGAISTSNASAGTTNLGGGGGGGGNTGGPGCGGNGGNGGSGVVILKYSDSLTITVGAGLTSSETSSGGFKIRTFTAGTGNVSWA